MAIKKYINTKDIVKLTGHSDDEIRKLAQSGVLPAHRTRRNYWRFSVPEVENYFGIVINNPTETSDKQLSVKNPSITSEQITKEKFISRLTATKYLKCSNAKFESLVKEGVIQAHRDEKMRWRVSKESVLKLIDQPSISNSLTHKSKKSAHRLVKRPLSTTETLLIINENHYQEVLQRICTAKSSIKIMTASFKRFNLKPTDNQGDTYFSGTPFIKYLMAKAVQGVSVQIICSMPSSSFSDEWKEYYRQMMKPGLFDYMHCERNHAKIFIIDDKFAYVGSANVTPAGLGQGIFTPGNIEAGILTENPEIVSSVKDLFSMIWERKFCNNCHRTKECKKSNK